MDEAVKQALQRKLDSGAKPKSKEEIILEQLKLFDYDEVKFVVWYRDTYGGDTREAIKVIREVLAKHPEVAKKMAEKRRLDRQNSKGCMITILIMITATSLTSLLFL